MMVSEKDIIDEKEMQSERGAVVWYRKWNEKCRFWREGPDGSKILMANTRQYSQLWFVCELPPDVGNCRQGLPAYLQQFSAPEYKPDAVLMFGSQLENTRSEERRVGKECRIGMSA